MTGKLAELVAEHSPLGESRVGPIIEATLKQPCKDEFQILAPGGKGTLVRFGDRELFCRFCSLNISHQADFLRWIRASMSQTLPFPHIVPEVHLTVQWSTNTERTIIITLLNSLDDLSFKMR